MSDARAGLSFHFAALIAMFVIVVVAARFVVHRRGLGMRGEIPGWAAVVAAVGCITLLTALANVVWAQMSSGAQAVVIARARLLSFLFWLGVFSVPGLTGAWGITASFAILGWVERGDGAPRIPVFEPFANEYWTVVDKAEQLTRRERGLVWLRHEAFSVMLLLVAGVGLLMTFGLPRGTLLPYLVGSVIAALLLNPARADRRRAARLAEQERQAALVAETG